MRVFTGAWAGAGVLFGVLLLAPLPHWRWGFAMVICGLLLFATLVFPHRVPVWAGFAGMVLSVGAAAEGLIAARTTVCCMFAVTERRGYPFEWLVRHADYMDLPARVPPASFADDAPWRVEVAPLLADLVIWGVIGLAVMVGFSLLVRQAGRVGLLRIRQGSFLDSGNA